MQQDEASHLSVAVTIQLPDPGSACQFLELSRHRTMGMQVLEGSLVTLLVTQMPSHILLTNWMWHVYAWACGESEQSWKNSGWIVYNKMTCQETFGLNWLQKFQHCIGKVRARLQSACGDCMIEILNLDCTNTHLEGLSFRLAECKHAVTFRKWSRCSSRVCE